MNFSTFTINIISKIFSMLVRFKPLYGILKPANKSYSQKGEDLIIQGYFRGRKTGYYLDIGCFHPRWASNTYLFHNKGWIGTVVDIDEYKLNWFKWFRRGKVNTVCAAVVDSPKGKGSSKVYKFDTHKGGWSLIDTLDKKVAINNRAKGWGNFKEENINTIDINTLLDSLPIVNFLSIDIEGMDTKIISKIDLSKHKIELILFEDNDNNNASGAFQLEEKLKKEGYYHLFSSGGSICYALKRINI